MQLPGLTSPLTDQQLSKLQQALAEMSPLQMSWVSGYLAALSQAGAGTIPAGAPVAAAGESLKLTILVASQTGNAAGVAKQLKAKADEQGVAADVVSMGDFKPNKLKNEKLLAIVASTHGEGEPPDDAEELHSFLVSKKAPKLNDAQYTVLSLGDSSYEFYCQTGKDFDERLGKLGAQAFVPRVDCDVDYDEAAATWIEDVVAKAKELTASSAAPTVAGTAAVSAPAESQYNKKNPFNASLLTNQKITGRDSIKDIRHIEIDLEGSDLQYQAGDALGVWFENDAALVDELLTLVKLEGNAELRAALINEYELTLSYPGFIKGLAEVTGNAELKAMAEDATQLRDYIADRQIIDIVRDYPLELTAEQLTGALRKMAPRLYSIASSQAEVDEEVHLTVGVVSYDAHGKPHMGGASGFLAERLEDGGQVKVFVEPNNNFRLPANPETPIIMVGPGTGVAPFRSFMQQRDADGIEGNSWMFFGNPHFTQDFLYQVEWQGYLKSGALERMDVAFSRDQEQKVYVQHRLLEQGKDVYAWLERGAHFYVCGDANQMAKDVHEALQTIVQEHGGKSEEEAQQYLTELRKAKRYQRDVY
ncbi:assimilatory sulfite reductase (NADPH) flavoprotein subunit [Echinimonas agarilytica]|uniref:Sulfite reductase [NADPH] flavoprotein alpha-component n=1 Tax=Echinimonas agarilytica TaxID=1215918 RepID=A0AA42B6G2_9GAMM|nr:assimilatory sulfite reductase (NADPH) flavoprotein subunit [Echinimonas agarilytica]MCM2678727.1 assimilatory sulfite reductase (NADPH) flavoprotein subunit [Echinimonas agarilytica]